VRFWTWIGVNAILPTQARRGELVVEFHNVGLRYGIGPEVLRDISFRLEAGAFRFLTGASGAGKSSLIQLMYLAFRPTRGLISLFGHDVITLPRRKMPAVRRRVGVVFQDFRLLDHLSAFDNVALPLRIAGVPEAQVKSNTEELLAWVGLADRFGATPPTLSGGEKQRVAIARAVIAKPELLLADEPTGNLDDKAAVRLLRLLEELNRQGTTVVIATHNEALVGRFAHPRMHIEDGDLTIIEPVESAPPVELRVATT
jgi:cell division transport system ATP-binding protein